MKQEVFQPKLYGKYVLSRQLAVGGMAEVYRGRSFGEEGIEKLIAMKILHSHLTSEQSFVNMFTNEGRLAISLDHVNVVPVYDFGAQDGMYFLAMEYVNGCDLAELIVESRIQDKKIPLGLAIWIIIEICNGLDYAHRKHDDEGHFLQLIHRDITPQNILISHEGEVKLADFGIAKFQSVNRDETSVGTLKGKVNYMSPEQVSNEKMDHRSDLFSLGIVSWELLTGFRFFNSDNMVGLDILDKIQKAEYIPMGSVKPGIPHELDQILSKTLAKNPMDRFSNIAEFRLALLKFLSHSQLFPSRAHLAAFVRKLFRKDLNLRKQQIATETREARQLREMAEGLKERKPQSGENYISLDMLATHGYNADAVIGQNPLFSTGTFGALPIYHTSQMESSTQLPNPLEKTQNHIQGISQEEEPTNPFQQSFGTSHNIFPPEKENKPVFSKPFISDEETQVVAMQKAEIFWIKILLVLFCVALAGMGFFFYWLIHQDKLPLP